MHSRVKNTFYISRDFVLAHVVVVLYKYIGIYSTHTYIYIYSTILYIYILYEYVIY